MKYMGMEGGLQVWDFIKQVCAGRWFSVFASFFMMMGTETTYIYGTYSKVIKSQFDYTQTQINTLGFAKDLGSNWRIFTGLLAEVAPSSVLLFISTFLNFSCFFTIWLSITHRIAKPQFWQMLLYICVGTNSSNFANTAILVNGVRNFPDRRGIILGLLKGFVGIGGAVLTQLYLAFYGHDDPSDQVLLFSWLPSVLILILFTSIRPINSRKHLEELKVFYHLLYISIFLALFILFVTIAQKQASFSHAGYVSGASVIIVMLCLPLVIAFREEFFLYKLNLQNKNKHPPNSTSVSVSIILEQQQAASKETAPPTSRTWLLKIMNKPAREEDFTILQAMFSKDMALVCFATFSRGGSSLAAIDNLGQIGESLHYPPKAISIFVSWVSIFSFFSRVCSSFISETLMVRYKLPRPLIFSFAFLITSIGQLCIVYPIHGSVYPASLIIGFGFGSQVPLLFAVISELFGLKHYSTLFNCGQLIVPLGSYILNVEVVGKLYDMEASREHNGASGKGLTCEGAHCFNGSFTILAISTLFGALSMLVLAYRTREFYKGDVYNKYKEDLWIQQSKMEFYHLDKKKNVTDY